MSAIASNKPNATSPPASLATDLILLSRDPINSAALVNHVRTPADGAVVTFDGCVRNQSHNRRTLYLDYEAYESMAVAKLHEIAADARARFAIDRVAIAHRLGRLEIGETSVFIAVSSPHRPAGFEACRHIIDTLKRTVPIWKKEYFEDGAGWADGELPPTPPNVTDAPPNSRASANAQNNTQQSTASPTPTAKPAS
jgi:molybdopterin synthase catalytic subunit